MEIKDVIKELKDYKYNKKYLDNKQEEINRLEEQINKVTATYSFLPKSTGLKKDDLIAKKIDLDIEFYNRFNKLKEQQLTVEKTIQSLEQPYKNILDFKYIELMKLWEVAFKVGYSDRQCARLLQEAYKLYAEKRNNV